MQCFVSLSKLTLHFVTFWVCTELILLGVCASEDIVAQCAKTADKTKFEVAEIPREVYQVASLDSICHGQPRVQPKHKHISSALCCRRC